ncbi:hypothetical protein POS17_3415 [Pseudomonas sp. Os17]|nr:hypothetical protein POS17_3415 [Pseudomonas sp. Os17]
MPTRSAPTAPRRSSKFRATKSKYRKAWRANYGKQALPNRLQMNAEEDGEA